MNLVAAAVSKNEGRYLPDWINWHLRLGVEHFFIYDACTEELTFRAIEAYVWSGVVTLIPTTFHPCQNQAIIHSMRLLASKASWVMVCDIDEFLCPHGLEDLDFRKFLSSLPAGVGGVAFPWHCFGSNDRDIYEPIPVWKRITKRVDYNKFKHSKHIKSIMRPETVAYSDDPHWIKTKQGFHTVDILGRPITISEHPHGYLPTDKVYWAHYVTKTREEWGWKFARGSADSGPNAYNARKMEDFDKHMAACTYEDLTMIETGKRLGMV